MAWFSRLVLVGITGVGCVGQALADEPSGQPRVKVELRRAENKPAEGLIEATVANSKDKIYLHKTADATNEDISDVRVDTLNNPATVIIVFTKEGAKKMAKLSEDHKGKPLAFLADGIVLTAPTVKAAFRDQAIIKLSSKEEAGRIVKGIKGK
jgi:preprotein translocase subunit SecD